ncbi:MAG: peptide-methionine (S)-S-oxide reductase MsrA [Chthoniobacterales bacterium]|nr:peptide-methionine (S)-S-oxide reductase MsrA [Chthoniobacterales bacterium]
MSIRFATLFALIAVLFPLARAQERGPSETRTVVLAGGCFWCMQQPFDQVKGVLKTVVGYSGGDEVNPTYSQVSGHKTGHRESIQVTYDPALVSYEQLLDVFWHNINPTQAKGQFADIGLSYQAAIFCADDEQKKVAEASKQKLAASGNFEKPIVTETLGTKKFYPAEEYHQKYYLKNPGQYEAYHVGSGRVAFLRKVWGATDH